MNYLIWILIAAALFLGTWFVNDTKKKHGVCCGKACAGCPIVEKRSEDNTTINN